MAMHCRRYYFPNGTLIVRGRRCFFELEATNVSIEYPRAWVAEALRMLRAFRKNGKV